MENKSDYEIQKDKNKQKLVRNEFLYNGIQQKYDFPIIKKQNIDINKIEFLSYTNSKTHDTENKNKTIHFFTYDWLFEKVYEKADEEIDKLSQYYCLLSPDFSMFINMPKALQIYSTFKNRWCGAFWQSKGLNVIPTVSWGDESTFDFCFEGIEEGSIVAVCTYYRENDEESFMKGYNQMLKKIKPCAILCYDEPFKSMKGNVKFFVPTTYEWTKTLDWKDQAKFYYEKHNRNVVGLNEKDFKFIDYKDPYERKFMKKCDVCGNVVLIDEYGNGKCNHCSWEQGGSSLEEKFNVGYPNLIPLSKAKKLYINKMDFYPDFEDFINNLKFYGEMEFYYQNTKFFVTRDSDEHVEFYMENSSNILNFNNIKEFEEKSSIDNHKLKDIWHNIKKVYWLS